MFQNKIIALQNNDNHVFWMSLINKQEFIYQNLMV